MDAAACFRECRSGVAQIRLVVDGQVVGGGTGFLVEDGIVTNSHVVRGTDTPTLEIGFEDSDPGAPNSFVRVALANVLVSESPADERNYAYLRLNEPEFEGRHRFAFVDQGRVAEVGEQVAFMGYPFSMHHLTCHLAFVSSVHDWNGTSVIQLDGSVNAGNSGGPLVEVASGRVIGIVTRAHTGLIEDQFRELIRVLRQNQQVLSNTGGAMVSIGGIDPIKSLAASQRLMETIASPSQ